MKKFNYISNHFMNFFFRNKNVIFFSLFSNLIKKIKESIFLNKENQEYIDNIRKILVNVNDLILLKKKIKYKI